MVTVHATCIAFEGRGVLLRGPSGSGKSDLAVRALAEGARLVADDQVAIAVRDNALIASAPEPIHGMIEVRGLGIVRVETESEIPVSLVADLMPPDSIERMPESRYCELMGRPVRWMAIAPFESSAVAKLRLALTVTAEPERLAQ